MLAALAYIVVGAALIAGHRQVARAVIAAEKNLIAKDPRKWREPPHGEAGLARVFRVLGIYVVVMGALLFID